MSIFFLTIFNTLNKKDVIGFRKKISQTLFSFLIIIKRRRLLVIITLFSSSSIF